MRFKKDQRMILLPSIKDDQSLIRRLIMKFCQVCDVFVVKYEVSYLRFSEDKVSCCEGCFEDHYQGDDDIREIVVVKDRVGYGEVM